MKTLELYMMKDGSEDERLSYKDLAEYGESCRLARPEEMTLEAMTQMLDLCAEDCNAHDFVCVHRGLAAILMQEIGREAATKVMRRLVNYQGLHGLVGVCGEGDVENAEKELKLSLRDWSYWSLA